MLTVPTTTYSTYSAPQISCRMRCTITSVGSIIENENCTTQTFINILVPHARWNCQHWTKWCLIKSIPSEKKHEWIATDAVSKCTKYRRNLHGIHYMFCTRDTPLWTWYICKYVNIFSGIIYVFIYSITQDIPIVVAGNKLDLASTHREVQIEDVSEWVFCELPKLR